MDMTSENAVKNMPVVTNKKIYLDELVRGIGFAVVNSKTLIDTTAMKIRKDVYEKNDMLKLLPLSTFVISDIDVDLKFVSDSIEKDSNNQERIVIKTDVQNLTAINAAVSGIKFKLSQKSLATYKVDNETILREE